MAGKFDQRLSKSGEFYFVLKAGNGQVILQSQTYGDKRSALAGIESVRKNSASEARFELKTARDGSAYFALNATNGQSIGKSEMYNSLTAMKNGIASVRKNAPDARVVDQTAG